MNEIEFDVLVRRGGGPAVATVDTVEALRPSGEDVERVRRALAGRGVEVHPTEFGVAGRCPAAAFESLFGVEMTEDEDGALVPVAPPQPPAEIAHLVEQVTVSRRPQLF